jgi:two-component system, cell cycle sensor histidine kinase and response regulator CckA
LKDLAPPSQLKIFGGGAGEAARYDRNLRALLGGAIAASVLLLWFSSKNVALIGAMVAGLLVLGALIIFFRKPGEETAGVVFSPPDWAVTRAAADFADAAIAISDRAGRLVCANGNYAKWFEGLRVPSEAMSEAGARELLIISARMAWRDGEASIENVDEGAQTYAVRLQRSGTGDEYLLWWFAPIERIDLAGKAMEFAGGPIGRSMAEAGVGAVTVSPSGRIVASNATFCMRATGSEVTNLSGKDFAELMRLDDKGRIFFEREGRRGSPIRLVHVPLPENEGQLVNDSPSLLLLLDDDANMIDHGSALAQVQNMLATLPLGLAMVDRDGRFLFANDAFARVVEMTPEELPLYPGDLVIPDDKAAVSQTIRRYARGQALSGDLGVISLSIAGIRGLGEAAVLLGLKDNSEESKLKRQVAQATKMQAVGQLAGGVAHDFNNILTAIIGYCDLMLLRHQPGDSDYDDIQQIRNNSNRAASLTRQLLAFSRQQTLRPQVLQLPDVVADVSHLLKRLIGEKVQLEVNHGRGIGAVRADPGQLEQVIINLCVNARDAMPEGGVLLVETAAVTQTDARNQHGNVLPTGDYVRLSVIDGGTGISKENLGKIFEPFFTTKDVGKGTGLGLSTVYGIVKQSGGYIFAESEPGQGTRFDVFLPVHVGDIVPADTAKKPKSPPAKDLWGSGRILLVEDEDMVRAVAERALTRQGYSVTVARDGEDGLAHFAEGRSFDLVISDVVMPNMDGPTMARAIREQHGKMRLLFMSGYAEEQLRESINLENVSFLPKPFSVQQISEAVRDALSS